MNVPKISTSSQIAKLAEDLKTFQAQETSARSAIEQATEQLTQIHSAINTAKQELARLEERAQQEQRELEISQTAKQLRPLADEFNQTIIRLIRLARQIKEIDPHERLVEDRGQLLNGSQLPIILHQIGQEKLHTIPKANVSDWRNRGVLADAAEAILKEIAK